MQLIITDARIATSRTIQLNGFKIVAIVLLFCVFLVFMTLVLYQWLYFSGNRPSWLPVSQYAEFSSKDEVAKRDRYMRENLDVLARRLGAIQTKIVQLESLGDRISSLNSNNSVKQKDSPGKGGPLVLTDQMSMIDLETMLTSLEQRTSERNNSLSMIESRLVDMKVRRMMIPTGSPIKEGIVGSSFGWRIDPISGQSALHEGLDFKAEQGTPILAAAGGVIVTQEYHSEYGNMLEIAHGGELITRYAHAVKTVVKKGDFVRKGQFIAEVGSTGRSTGPHLHFEVLLNGVPQDPQKFLDAGQSVLTAQSIGHSGIFEPQKYSASDARESK